MTLPELLEELHRRRITLRADGEALRIEAPPGAASETIVAALALHKRELLERLARLPVELGVDDELPPLVRRPEERHEPFGLTDIQQAYWVGRRDEVEFGAAIHAYVELEGADLDVARVQEAWNRLIRRHEMLRSVVDETGEQRVLEDVPDYEIPTLDLRELAAGAADETLARLRERMTSQRLALDRWPLFELQAVRLPGGATRLFLDIDCTLVDSWSLQLLYRELVAAYEDPGSAFLPPALELTFRDYVTSIRAIEGTPAHARSVAYWDRRLETLPPAPQLPLRPGGGHHGGFRRWAARIEAAQYARLRERAVACGITPMSLLIAAYAEVIGSWAESPHFTLNVPLFNRLPIHPHVNHVVGTFSSFALLEVDLRQGATFAERAAVLHKRMLEDLNHRHGGGVRLLRELMRREGSISAGAMPVVFTSFAGGVEGMESFWIDDLGAAFGEVVHSVTQTPQVWIDHQVLYQHGGLYLNWDACEDLFSEGLVGTMFDAYTALLSRLADDSRSWHETGALVAARSDSVPADAAPAGPVYEQFLRHAAAHPDRPAVIAPEGPVGYRELRDRALLAAGTLLSLPGPPDAPVAVLLPSGSGQATCALGAMLAGRPYMPIDADLPPQRMLSVLDRAGAAAVVAGEELAARAADPSGRPWLTVEALVGGQPPGSLPIPAADDPCCVIHTSGTTGLPSAVLLSHSGLRNALDATTAHFGVGAEDRTLALTPTHHDMSLYDLLGALSVGGAVVVPDPDRRRDPSHWVELMHRHAVTIWNSVPAMMVMLLDHLGERGGLARAPLRLAFLGGDWIPLELPMRLRAHVPDLELVSVGGPTETTLWNIWYPIGAVDPDWSSIPYGRPIPNVRYYVMDERLRERPDWAAGELCCAGAGVALGYLGDAELTAQRFVAHPVTGERLYRTGDLGRRRPDGVIELLGRTDFQVQLNGRRIEPREIEIALSADERVDAAVVVPVQRTAGTGLAAFYTSACSEPVAGEQLAAALREELPGHLIPQRWIHVDRLPLTASGKIDRKALMARASAEADAQADRRDGPVAPPAGTGLERDLSELLAEILGVDRIDPRRRFFDLGATSVHLVRLHALLRDRHAIEIAVTDLFEHPDIASLVGHLSSRGVAGAARVRSAPASDDASAPIAIIGMSCRYPGAPDVESFWRNLVEGRESVSFFSEQELLDAGVDPRVLARPDYVRAAAVLDDVAGFDAELFGFTAQEAELTDPQQRLFLECAWEALEAAGYAPGDPEHRVGVFAGKSISNYMFPVLDLADPINYFRVVFGNDKGFVATQTSYKLDLTGPSVSIDTACSTSLVTVDAACAALRSGACELALSGGASLKIPQVMGYDGSQEAGMFAPDGHARPFDAAAAGLVPGSGVGVVVLKRLDRALADADPIHAVIRGVAVNNDGSGKVGFSAPSVAGQRRCIEDALDAAGVSADSISYVEAHGTGTPMGDPIEVEALHQAFRPARGRGWCALGSVKSNFGHLDSAAGVAGLMKAALALEHELIPPTLNFSAPNPAIDFERSPFFVAADALPWTRGGAARRAGVSSFGVGGTNAHAILEEAPDRAAVRPSDPDMPLALPITAQTPAAMSAYAERYRAFLAEPVDGSIQDVVYTAQVGRRHLQERALVVATGVQQLRERCEALARGAWHEGVLRGSTRDREPPEVAFLFPGHGSQYPGMCRSLYETEPTFRAHMQRCDELLRARHELPLIELLYPKHGEAPPLRDIVSAQVALFAVSTALADLWRSWGIHPAAIMGHSVGELAGAHVAGILSLEDALALVTQRIRLIETHGLAGRTIVASAGEQDVATLLAEHPGAGIASHNGPDSLVLSGDAHAITTIEAALAEQGIAIRDLHAPRAAHSPMMEPVIPLLTDAVADLEFGSPQIPLVSNLSGAPLAPGEFDASYVGRHLREPVRLSQGYMGLRGLGCDTFLEVGPRPALTILGARSLPDEELAWVPSLHRDSDDRLALRNALGQLFVRGADVDWRGLHRAGERRRVVAPTYPFQRKRHWSSETIAARESRRHAQPRRAAGSPAHPLLGSRQHNPVFAADERHYLSPDLGGAGPGSWTRQHGAFGVSVLPATSFVELACAAARELGRPLLELSDLVIHRPLVLASDGAPMLHVVVEDATSDRPIVRVHAAESADGSRRGPRWTLHAEAVIGGGAIAPPDDLDLEALRSEATSVLSGEAHHEAAAARGAEFGEAFRSLSELWMTSGWALGRVIAPPTVQAELGAYEFHPALLDACLQAAVAAAPDPPGEALLIPASIGRCTLFAAPGPELWTSVRLAGDSDTCAACATVTICRPDGRAVALVEDLRLVPVDAGDVAALDPHAARALVHRRGWQALADDDADALVARDAITLVSADQTARATSVMRLALAGEYDRVELRDPGALAEADDVVYLAGQHDDPGPEQVSEELWTLAGVVRTLAARGAGRLTVLVAGAEAVTEDDHACPVQAALASLTAVAAAEHPELACRCIDVDLHDHRSAGRAARLIAAGCEAPLLTVRDGRALVPRMTRAEVAGTAPALDAEATYLITGGCGRLGLLTARLLADGGARSLMLVGRSAERHDEHPALVALRKSGARVELVDADVADLAQVRAIMDRIDASGRPLRGVFHAAAVVSDELISRLTREQLEAVCAPKVAGAWNLAHVTASRQLDHFLLFSSIAAERGLAGQGAYAAANGALRALAQARVAAGLPALCVEWGPWAGSAAAPADRRALAGLREAGIEPLPAALGARALATLIAAAPPGPVVTVARLRAAPSESNGARPAASSAEPRPASATFLQQLLEDDYAGARDRLTQIVRESVAALTGIAEPQAISHDSGFATLGLDSMGGVELRNRLQARIERRLPATVAFNHPTVEQLTEHLAKLLLEPAPA